MKGYIVYGKVHQLREAGFSQRAAAETLGINRKTVKRYWDMPLDEYESKTKKVSRIRALDPYRDQIVSWLRQYPTLTAAQACDWLKEHYTEDFSERTFSRYVKDLREEYHLSRHPTPRSYQAVPELPMGQQMQMDFGQTTLKNVDGSWTKVYVAAFLLSHSRYKYAQLQSRSFTSVDLVNACHSCFRYWGGMPKEMVFDQDSIVCVSQNAGDIIYTYEFEKFRQDCKMAIYLCRGADPESKGKIEKTVKFIKGNFLSNRLILTVFGDLLCEHRISTGRGLLIQNKSHQRDRTTALDRLQDSLDEQLLNQATDFLQRIREEKSRYARDQFRLLQSLLDRYGVEQTLSAITFCLRSNLCSANTVRDFLEHQAEKTAQELPFTYPPQIPVNDPKYHVTAQKRSLDIYAKVGGQEC